MKTKLISRLFPLWLLCLAVCHETLAQGTAFTYQGRLEFNGAPANGSYDFMFRLMNDPTNGVAAPVIPINLAVPVTNGLFTTGVDFGAANIDGTNLWLEVNVRTNNSASFTALSPRQPLTATPYATRAANASNLSGTLSVTQLNGQLSGAQIANGAVGAANVDNAQVQLRITGTAPAGQFITGIAANGSVTVGPDTTDWKLGGNNVSGGQFLGSTNNQPVDIKVRGSSALRLLPTTNDAPNVVGGAPGNLITSNVVGSIIGGGGTTNYTGASNSTNFIGADFSVVAGGMGNRVEASARNSSVGGGLGNVIQVPYSTIAGGSGNLIEPGNFTSYCFIGGGAGNIVSTIEGTIGGGNDNMLGGTPPAVPGGTFINVGQLNTIAGGGGNFVSSFALGSSIGGGAYNYILGGENATIGGGLKNTNTGNYATIPGGDLNVATANSFAAGHRAKATNTGAFVWADSQNADFASTANNQFLVRASGGVGINTTNPAATLDVNGSLRVGNGTTVFNNLQAGLAQMATDSATVKTNFTFSFPKAFGSVPNVLVSARSASDVDDTFAVTVRRVTTTTCTVNVVRTDTAAGWGQHMQVTWMAWE